MSLHIFSFYVQLDTDSHDGRPTKLESHIPMTSHGFACGSSQRSKAEFTAGKTQEGHCANADAIHQRADEISLVIVLSLRGEGRSMLMEAKACAVAGAAVCKRNADFSCARAALGTFSSVYDKRDLKIYQNDRFFCSPNRSPLIKARRHDECRVLPAMRSAKKFRR